VRILVTNDDGISAPGLLALVAELANEAEVIVIAPERQQSATGHAITLHKPLRLDEVEITGATMAFSSNGTPADCVILGNQGDLPRPDLVVSGINAGANMGEEVLYSGTASAAMEAALQGVPSVAISVAAYTEVLYEGAASFARLLAREMLKTAPLPVDTFFNVNVPNVEACDLKGPCLTRLGRRQYKNHLSRRIDPRGRPYYWFAGAPLESEGGAGSDIYAVAGGQISITPIHFDLTAEVEQGQLTPLMDLLVSEAAKL
jgi:5'-nucleotidase